MEEREVKMKITLEGEKEYKEALDRMCKSVKEFGEEVEQLNVALNKTKETLDDISLKYGRKILYLCDGMVSECSKSHCYKNADENPCRHTSDINHAVNFKNFMEKERGEEHD